jgi:hypothetical protein
MSGVHPQLLEEVLRRSSGTGAGLQSSMQEVIWPSSGVAARARSPVEEALRHSSDAGAGVQFPANALGEVPSDPLARLLVEHYSRLEHDVLPGEPGFASNKRSNMLPGAANRTSHSQGDTRTGNASMHAAGGVRGRSRGPLAYVKGMGFGPPPGVTHNGSAARSGAPPHGPASPDAHAQSASQGHHSSPARWQDFAGIANMQEDTEWQDRSGQGAPTYDGSTPLPVWCPTTKPPLPVAAPAARHAVPMLPIGPARGAMPAGATQSHGLPVGEPTVPWAGIPSDSLPARGSTPDVPSPFVVSGDRPAGRPGSAGALPRSPSGVLPSGALPRNPSGVSPGAALPPSPRGMPSGGALPRTLSAVSYGGSLPTSPRGISAGGALPRTLSAVSHGGSLPTSPRVISAGGAIARSPRAVSAGGAMLQSRASYSGAQGFGAQADPPASPSISRNKLETTCHDLAEELHKRSATAAAIGRISTFVQVQFHMFVWVFMSGP